MDDTSDMMHDARPDLMGAVRKLRKALGLSQTEFGRLIGKSLPTIQRWETVRPPRGNALAALARTAEKAGREELATEFLAALGVEIGPLGGPPVLEFPLWVGQREWIFMRLAQKMVQDKKYQHLWKPYLELVAPIYKELATESDLKANTFSKLLKELAPKKTKRQK